MTNHPNRRKDSVAARARAAGGLYRIEIEPAHYLDTNFNAGRGYKAVIRWGDEAEPAWSSHAIYSDTDGYSGRRMRLEANLKKSEIERYFLATGRRWEVVRRAQFAEEQRRKEEVKALRQALIDDRVMLYDALADLTKIVDDTLDGGRYGNQPDVVMALKMAQVLLDKHAVAVAAIKAAVAAIKAERKAA